MKKARIFCKLFMWGNIGAFIGKSLQTYFFYKKNPSILELMSAPWYAELCIPLIGTIVVTAILIFVMIILKRKDKAQYRKDFTELLILLSYHADDETIHLRH